MTGPSGGWDPRWTIRHSPIRPAVADEAVFSVGSGGFAIRAAPEESGDASPGVLAAGVYAGVGAEQHLLEGPIWTRVESSARPAAEFVLDLHDGVLYRRSGFGENAFRSLRFACALRPGVMGMRVFGDVRPGPPMRAPGAQCGVVIEYEQVLSMGSATETRCLRVESEGGAIVGAAAQRVNGDGLERVAAFVVESLDRTGAGRAARKLQRAWHHGFDELLADHRAAWARRWSEVGIELPDDPETEVAVRYALFQLWCNADAHGESAVGARGISGAGYRGHVFWDADVFVLPALVSMDPAAAAAMLEYRRNRLGAARSRARAEGRHGARFPWESAADGTDVTPRTGFLGGTAVPIRTGAQEEHVTADIAWAADHYAEWIGSTHYLESDGRDLLIETARYWASRIRLGEDGRGHIDAVIGPDEYHETVDDNAYTNVMARWNLRRASRLLPRSAVEATEFGLWKDLAERIVDGLGADGRYEQFRGYYGLETLTVTALGGGPVAADVLLGQARVAGSQLIKQPDVLMLHHLVPDEVAPDSLAVNLEYYGPRTTHGSSLSPAVMACVLARAGRPDEALEVLRPALRMDLDDRSAMTSGGLHLATMGGVWQAVLMGFAGVRVRGGVLSIRPSLPARWPRLGLAFHCLGRRIRLDLSAEGVRVVADGPIPVSVGDTEPVVVTDELFCPTPSRETL
ncbi:glycosyl hydrolase family 65 protein [Nocardia pseudobrasiliensis]|uniref:Trehalose/maltose hydrolase-like predicted phosphorylase n=1 Tax=Nocardia pseudobrasiliensis TaxID=45979 RepID=A0A370IC56_9NOCA|nr:glycosyl hydrolase family 65 protein [Nocardia pseudobrasiliensis]RDI68287.1 trehalose/maltose hydrolase-like predicted phosphorylase [Nocardia pseudobrasiliensis]